jgi:hypothetical protein
MRDENGLSSINRPSLLEHLVAIGVATLLLEQHSRLPQANWIALGVVTLIVFGLSMAYCIRLVVLLRSKLDVRLRESFLNWMVFPALLVLMFTSAATHWPASVRFYLSKASFDRLVEQAHSGRKLEGFPRRVGLYWIEEVRDDSFRYESGEGTLGFVTGEALIDPCGLLYDNANLDYAHYLTTRIAPDWYITEW